MSKSDVVQRQQQEREEWRKGVGGIVKSVDISAATVTLANSLFASGKPVVVHISQDTKILRYAADSIKFDDAKPGSLDQIRAGDQLRARGTTNADGIEFTAQAIVSGSFRDVAGTVISTDPAASSISVMDLATKQPVVVKVSSESQLHKLPPLVAQMIAFRLKGGSPGGQPGAGDPQAAGEGTGGRVQGNEGHSQGNWAAQSSAGTSGPTGAGSGSGGNWHGGNGPPDFQQMLSRMPAVTIADLNKGDAVMLVATEGSSHAGPTAIIMPSGGEAIIHP